MAYGVEILNNRGNLILSEQHGAFRLKSTGSVSAGNTITVGDDELLFIRASTVPTTTTVMRLNITTSGDMSPSIDVDYIILDRFKDLSIPPSAYGLNVRGSNGDLHFSSEYLAQKHFNILELNSDYASLDDGRNYRQVSPISTPSIPNRSAAAYTAACATYWDIRATNLPGITLTTGYVHYLPGDNAIKFNFSRSGPPVGYVQYPFGIVMGIEQAT